MPIRPKRPIPDSFNDFDEFPSEKIQHLCEMSLAALGLVSPCRRFDGQPWSGGVKRVTFGV